MWGVIAAQMLDAQLDARPDPLRRRQLLHGLWGRPGMVLDALPQSFPHVAAQGGGRTDVFPGARLCQ